MTAAAAALFVAQPALSRAVRQLERELGVAPVRAGRPRRRPDARRRGVRRPGARRALRSIDALHDVRATGGPRRPAGHRRLTDPADVDGAPAAGRAARAGHHAARAAARVRPVAEVHELVAAGPRRPRASATRPIATRPRGRAARGGRGPAGLAAPGSTCPTRSRWPASPACPSCCRPSGSERRHALDRFFEACGLTPTVAVESDERSRLDRVRPPRAGVLHLAQRRVAAAAAGCGDGRGRSSRRCSRSCRRCTAGATSSPATLLLLDVFRQFAELPLARSGGGPLP